MQPVPYVLLYTSIFIIKIKCIIPLKAFCVQISTTLRTASAHVAFSTEGHSWKDIRRSHENYNTEIYH